MKVFNIIDEIQQVHSSQRSKERYSHHSTVDFQNLVRIVKEHFDEYMKDETLDNQTKQERLELYHRASIGDPDAEKFLTNEIESFLREKNISNVDYPYYYSSLANGLFHEIYRFGILQKWYNMPDSVAATFIGREFWIENNDIFYKQEEELENENIVREFIQRFQAGHKTLKVNESEPYAEIALHDQTRVTIIVPPASYKPTLVFRKYVVSNYSFEKQAELKTIPFEDIPFYHTMANLYLNTIIAGHVQSGKSTFLKTIYGARDPKKVAVLIENTAESFLKKDFPERLVHELYTHNQDINHVIRRALRLDHDYIIVQEVRGIEAEGAIAGTERGRRGLLMSYHITEPENTPIQLAQHIVDVYPNRNQFNEMKRISKALDIGITMKSQHGEKKITSVYELGIDEEKGLPFINYLIFFNEKSGKWEYNSSISKGLIRRMQDVDFKLADDFLRHLAEREKVSRLTISPKRILSFGEMR